MQEKPKFSLLWATRGRHRFMQEVHSWWVERWSGEYSVEVMISLDLDDLDSGKAADKMGKFDKWSYKKLNGMRKGGNGAFNRAAYGSTGDILIQMSDDCLPPVNWDKRVVDLIPDYNEPYVLGVNDGEYGAKKEICTVLITTRAWAKKCGYFYCPTYPSMYADDDITRKARNEGCLINAWSKCMFKHDWKCWGVDETHIVQNHPEAFKQGKTILDQREKNGFPDHPSMWPSQTGEEPSEGQLKEKEEFADLKAAIANIAAKI